MKSVFICLAITLLAVAAVVQELGCNRSYALAAPAAAVPQTSGASAKRASLAKEVAPYMPLASNIEQRREVFDQLASGSDRTNDSSSSACAAAIPEKRERVSPGTLFGKGGKRRGPLYPEGAKVTGEGRVFLLVAQDETDTNTCSCQKFMVRLASGQTLLVVHEAKRALGVEALKLGDRIAFCGMYTHGQNGDEINGTIRNDDRPDEGGWIKHNGKTYQ